MKIKNTLEDLVYNLASNIIENNDEFPKNQKFKMDVICYVLNRIYPEYIVSYRGLIYEELEYKHDPQKLADIISLIYDGINIIKSRRKNEIENFKDDDEEDNEIEWDYSEMENDQYYYNFPQIIGEVLDTNTFEPINNAQVMLTDSNSNLLEMSTSFWKNPCITFAKTKGIFTFWPKSIKAAKDEEQIEKKFILKIVVLKEGYLKEDKLIHLDLKPQKFSINQIRRTNMLSIDPIYLSK
jgi:competence protein ComFB